MTTSVTEITMEISRYDMVFGEPPAAVYVGKKEWLEIKRYQEYYPNSILMDKRPKIISVPIYVVDSDTHFGIKARGTE